MLARPRSAARTAQAALVVAALAVTAPLSAQAAQAASPTQTVTFRLTSADPAAYRSLVLAGGLTRAERLARLRDVLPTAATRAAVTARLKAQGLHVVAETPWTVTAAGPARAASAPLAGLVTDVISGADKRKVVTPKFHASVVDGTAVRTLYGAPVGPASAATPLTIATIQFSGWNAAELTTYAGLLGVPDPVASGQYTPISVLGAANDQIDGDGDAEVALDQEAILATAPHVRQRAYFATNTAEGFVAAIEQVAADAAVPGSGIAALSISWGGCEDTSDPSLQPYYNAMNAAIQDAAAIGVTVFAASGDNGAYDCVGDMTTQAVDYPASDPFVLGVGGTTADADLLQEHAWSHSGGGESQLWDRPTYQASLSLGARNGRLVPDIAAVGDPNSGLAVFNRGALRVFGGTSLASPLAAATLTTTLAERHFTTGVGYIHPNLYAAGAASFRDIVDGTNGLPAGVGYDMVTGRGAPLWNKLITSLDSPPSLTVASYSRSRTIPLSVVVPSGMRYGAWDLALGAAPSCKSSDSAANAPTSVVVSADGTFTIYVLGVAYNGYCYTAKRTVIVDTVKPTVTAATTRARTTLLFSWKGADAAPGSGIASYAVTIRSGTAKPLYAAAATTAASKSLPVIKGKHYTVTVTATDKAGNVSTTVKKTVTA